jgi:hypothetical protein
MDEKAKWDFLVFFLLLKTFSMTIAAKKKVKMCQKEK